ncbi:MAG TPA: hypothetical protein VG267_22680 [Terracidiphilus sp.]|jgi:hypothetical protein|nr:hypothetical protein [Terracidiphilus sp.]
MSEIPQELDWVSVRAACTIEKMFEQLHHGIEEDVRRINQIRKYPEDRGFEVMVSGREFSFTVKRGETLRPFVRFTIEGESIQVADDADTVKLKYGIAVSDEGRCKLTEHGEDREQWQIRKSALVS